MTTVSTRGKALSRMSAQTKSAAGPSAPRARATSRGISSMPVTCASTGALAQDDGQRPRRDSVPAAMSRLASRPWPQPMSRTRARGAIRPRSIRWPKTGSQRSLPRAKCIAKRSSARTARSPRRPASATQPCRRVSCLQRAHRRQVGRCRVGARTNGMQARRAGRTVAARAVAAARRARSVGRSMYAPRCRRARAGCRRRQGRFQGEPGRHRHRGERCRSRAASSSRAADRAVRAPARGTDCAARRGRERSAARRR